MSEVENQAVSGDQCEEIIQSLPGRILPKRYRIDKLISNNEFAAVYRTFYEPEEKIVSLRVFRSIIKGEDDYQYKRFKQEAKKLIAMKHPNISKVLDVGLLEEGLPYLAMESVIGPTLEEVLVHQNRIEADQVVLIFSQVARAVQAAHDQGILHETLQPSKIVISETEQGDAIVRTNGFGLVSLHNKLGTGIKTPATKMRFIGTPAYMSPEQCYEGADVDGRSDVYSIGCMMYEAISGQVPFLATNEAVMKMHLEADATPVETLRKDLLIPRRLISAMEKCMVKDPTRRYQFVRDLQYDLERDVDPSEREQRTVIPEALQKAEQRVKDNKEHPLKLIGMIAACIGVLIVVLYVGSYVASMTSKLADNVGWKSKLDAGKKALSEGKTDDARTALEAALVEAKKFPPPDQRLAQTDTEIGAVNIITGRYSDALKNLRDAMLVEEESKKGNDASAARTLELLSAAELASDKLSEAEQHAKQSGEIAEHLNGENTVQLFQSYQQLFRVFIAEKKLDEAKTAIEKIKAAIASTNIILSMEVISGKKQAEAILSQASNKLTDAEQGLQDVLGSRQEKIGLGSLPTVDTMLLLGKLYASEGKYEKSTKILQSAYEAKQKLVGDCPAMAEMALMLGKIYDEAKLKDDAEKYYRIALETAEKTYGKGKIDTLPYIDALAKRLRSNGERLKAEVYESEAMDIRHPERVSKLGQH